MRTSGNDHADPVITSDDAAIANDRHDSTLQCRRPRAPVLCNRPSKLFSKPLDLEHGVRRPVISTTAVSPIRSSVP